MDKFVDDPNPFEKVDIMPSDWKIIKEKVDRPKSKAKGR
jgi:hypothetical protein